MCGILGLYSINKTMDQDVLTAMRDTMAHRGPDDAGLWISPNGRLGMAHRRLAIIDLSPGGHQPMLNQDGAAVIVFNGEIYNYRELRKELEEQGYTFRSASDTEVILVAYQHWGTECLQKFNGMFAFGLYDHQKQILFLARDRAGEKPLFYHQEKDRFVFASELKAIMADPAFGRRLNLEAFIYYLTYGYVPDGYCILQGVNKLPAGHALTYDLTTQAINRWRYWQLPEPQSEIHQSADELLEKLEYLLLDSVRLRLEADVPVGILLSGGIDSSLVTAMAARAASKPVKTFTISFPGHGMYDEGPHARMVAEYFGTDHIELPAESATFDLLPKLARQYDEPMADSSMIPTYLVSRLIRQHATVALGGDGGDELFAGYPQYNWIQRQERWRRYIPRPFRRLAAWLALRWLPLGLPGRNYIIGCSADLADSIAHVNMFFDIFSRKRLLAPLGRDGWQKIMPEDFKARLCRPNHSPLQQATRTDFQTMMIDDFLVKVDRASMLEALEIRVPWLDHRIIELAFGEVPDSLKANESERKILSRRLAQRVLPPTLDLNRKQGFSIPLSTWLKGDWGRFVREVLNEADPALFDQVAIRNLLAGQDRGYSNSQRIFALTIFELWRRTYQVSF